MTLENRTSITVGEPNWAPLEHVLPPEERMDFMYMGRVGEIELYKHRWTRRYLNIGSNCRSFYRYSDGKYVEVERSVALDHVRN
jgi:hypothetical protein